MAISHKKFFLRACFWRINELTGERKICKTIGVPGTKER